MIHWVNQYAVAPDQPGGTRHVDMAGALVEQGAPVTVIASDLNLTVRRYLRRDGPADRRRIREFVGDVPFVWLPAGSYQRNDWRRAWSMATFALHVLRYLLQVSTPPGSVFVGSTPHLIAAGATWLAARLRRVPFVLEVRDLWPESMEGVSGQEGGLVVRALRALSDLLYRRADAIVVLARPNIDRLVARGAERGRIHYVPNGVDVAAFESAPHACSLDVPADRKVFVYLGAHGPANGLDVAIRAARLLADRGEDDVQILLVGDGPAKDDLRKTAADLGVGNVTFGDPVPKTEVPALLRRCHGALMLLADVEVFRYGVSPNKLFDYLCAGVPVVANVPGEVARIVEESGGGVVVPPADAEALADAIAKLAREDRRVTEARDWVRVHHDRRRLAADFAVVLASVRSRPARPR